MKCVVGALPYWSLSRERLELIRELNFPKMLYDKNALIDAQQKNPEYSLYATAVFGDPNILNSILDTTLLEKVDNEGNTLASGILWGIATYSDTFVTKRINFICDNGVDINTALYDGSTILFQLVNSGAPQTMRAAKLLGIKAQTINKKGFSALSNLTKDKPTVLKYLLTSKTDLLVSHVASGKPILEYYTAINGFPRIQKALRKYQIV